MNLKRQIVRTIGTWALLTGFMMAFQPAHVPVILLIVPFVLLFGALYSLWNLLNMLRVRFMARQTWLPSRRLGLSVCLVAVLLIVLQSLGQLTIRDVLTVLAIGIIGYAYVARNLSRPLKS